MNTNVTLAKNPLKVSFSKGKQESNKKFVHVLSYQ